MSAGCCDSLSCKERLCALMDAYTALISGKGVQEVEFDGDRTRYHGGNVNELKAAMMRLHTTCGDQASAALLGIRGSRAPLCVRYGRAPALPRC